MNTVLYFLWPRGMRLTHDKTGAAIQQMVAFLLQHIILFPDWLFPQVWIGRYKAGFPSGTCWSALRGGAWLVGRWSLNKCWRENSSFLRHLGQTRKGRTRDLNMPSSTPTCKQHCLANGRTAHLFPLHLHNLSSSPTIKEWRSPDLQFVMTGRLWVKEDHLRLLPFLERVAAHCRKPSESGKPSCTETDTFEDIREREKRTSGPNNWLRNISAT